jgi:hypothetical protein
MQGYFFPILSGTGDRRFRPWEIPVRREALEELFWTCSRRARLTGVHLATEYPTAARKDIPIPWKVGRASVVGPWDCLYHDLVTGLGDADADAFSADDLLTRFEALVHTLSVEYTVALSHEVIRVAFEATVSNIVDAIRGST